MGIIGTLYFTSSKSDDLQETHLNGEETIEVVETKTSFGNFLRAFEYRVIVGEEIIDQQHFNSARTMTI